MWQNMALETTSSGSMKFYRLSWPLLALISMTSAPRAVSERILALIRICI